MACNRHKRKAHGEVVQVYRGIAADVKKIVDGLHGLESVRFGEVRKYYGNQKIRVRWGKNEEDKKVVRVEVCDSKFGEGVIRLRTSHPAAVARALHKGLKQDKYLRLYREKTAEAAYA